MNDFKKPLDFIKSAKTETGFESTSSTDGTSTIDAALDDSKKQALVVGSDIISFAEGVAPNLRESVTNSALLAQLVANAKVQDPTDIKAWYNVYFDSLQQLGWVVQEKTFSEHVESGTDVEVHQSIINLATVIFAAAPTTLAIIVGALNALQQASGADKKWLTIFKRESQKAKLAKFQVSVVEPDKEGVALTMMAFKLEAKNDLTQVLIIKVRKSMVKIEHSSGRISLAQGLLDTIGPSLARKVAKHSTNWIDSIGDI